MTTTVQERLVAAKYANRGTELGAHGKWRIYDRKALDSLPKPTWIIGRGERGGGANVLTDGLGLLFGDSNVGKSCTAIEWSCLMAAGERHWGRSHLRPGPVLYYATEAVRGMGTRMDACRDYHRIIGDYPLVVDATGMRLDDPTHVDAMREDIRMVKPTMVVLDPLVNCLGDWDENSSNDLALFFAALESTRQPDHSAGMLVVHHSGHDPSRPRGSSNIKARLDTVLKFEEVQVDERTSEAKVRLSCFKQREAAFFEPMRAVRMGHNEGVVLQWTGQG